MIVELSVVGCEGDRFSIRSSKRLLSLLVLEQCELDESETERIFRLFQLLSYDCFALQDTGFVRSIVCLRLGRVLTLVD